jgi:molecular chaperone GrpE
MVINRIESAIADQDCADSPIEDTSSDTAPEGPARALDTRITALEREKADNWDRYLRATADLENTRKRQKREIDDARLDTKNQLLKELLPVVDNLERAIAHAGQDDGDPMIEGVRLVLRQFTATFERLDVHPIEALGHPFDPRLHEAISQQESDAQPGTIVQVLQRGYRSGERLLRAALVVVAKTSSLTD